LFCVLIFVLEMWKYNEKKISRKKEILLVVRGERGGKGIVTKENVKKKEK